MTETQEVQSPKNEAPGVLRRGPADHTATDEPTCSRCEKPDWLCGCAEIKPLKTRLKVLILQHPQEPDRLLGTARLTQLQLERCTLKVGLSWANLAKALGTQTEPAKWGVLFLGGKGQKKPAPKSFHQKPAQMPIGSAGASGQIVAPKPRIIPPAPVLEISLKSGAVLSIAEAGLEGIIVLDGTWSQAKTLWWRNPWLLKLKRLRLAPRSRSLYGKLRREPRRECLSTIESVALALEAMGESVQVGDALRARLTDLLGRYNRASQASSQIKPELPLSPAQ